MESHLVCAAEVHFQVKFVKNILSLSVFFLHNFCPVVLSVFLFVLLQEVLEHFGDLLVAVITVDEMLRNQGTLHDHWTLFCRMLKSVHHDPVAVGVQAEKMRALEKLVGDYESSLLSGKIFQVKIYFIFMLKIINCYQVSFYVLHCFVGCHAETYLYECSLSCCC